MPNYVKYTTGSEELQALRRGNFYIGINDVKKGSTSSNGYYSGINPPNNGYTVYLNKASGGPSIYVVPDDANLIVLTNIIAGASYTTVTQCLSYFAGQSDKVITNKYYSPLITDSLALDLDAGYFPSYPTTGTTFYDVSPAVKDASLVNGPTYLSTGYFTMDGTDDNIRVASNIMSVTAGTVVIWLRTTDNTWLWCRGNDNNSFYLGATNGGGSWYDSNCGTPSYYINTASSGIPTGYLDGRFHMFEAKNVNLSAWTAHDFLNYGTGSNFTMYGDVARIMVYDKNLSAEESLQNYYQGAIVTQNIGGMYDAGNLVSFVPSATPVYYMSGTNTNLNGVLQNGVTYNNGSGGYWTFDGTDDRILLNGSTTNAWVLNANTNWTVTAWIRTTTNVGNVLGAGPIFTNSKGGPVYSVMCVNNGKATYWHYNGTWLQKQGSITVNDGKWYMITWVNRSNSTMDIYVNSTLDASNVSSALSSSNYLDIIGGSWAGAGSVGHYNGDIASLQINTTAFTQAQVNTNFEAQRYRFGI